MEYNLTKSARKFIRSEKARIRAQFLDVRKQEDLITELYKKMLGQEKNEANVQEEIKETKEIKEMKKVKEEEPKKTKVKKGKAVKKVKLKKDEK